MSCSIVYKVPAQGGLQVTAEFPNSFLGGMRLWDALLQKYMGTDASALMFNKELQNQLWNLPYDPRPTHSEKLALLTTFDQAMCRAKNFQALADAFCVIDQDILPQPNHFTKQIKLLRELVLHEDIVAVAWCQTSVSDDTWQVCEDPNDEYGEYRMYDISKDTGHFFIFDKLN